MKRFKKVVFGVMVALPVFNFGGCINLARIPFQFPLSSGLGTFEITAGGSTQNQGTGSLSGNSRTVGSASLSLDPDDVTFTPADNGGAKGSAAFQAGGSFTVTAGTGAFADVDTVCDTPVDEYGPFTVTLNADFSVNSISPSNIELEQSTLDLINAGEFSICLTIGDSTVSGTVTIDALSFSLGL